jgi:GPH family glycoside/pentoside/hexuronide:cation symporter
VQFFFLKFATDVLLMAPVLVGTLFGLGRLWDAFTDPMAGVWSDRTRTRLGRRRPWMFLAIPVMLAAFALLWTPPADLGETALALWVAAGLFAFFTGFTGFFIPHAALGAELSQDYHERTRIFGARQIFFTLGMFLAFAAIGYVTNSEDQRAAAARVVAVVVVGSALGMMVTPIFVRERAEYQGRGSDRPFRALRDVLTNPHARIVLFVQFIDSLGAGILGVMAPYFAEYVVKRPDLIGVLPAFFVFAGVASIPVWLLVSRRIGKKRTWLISMVLTAFAFGAQFLVGENDVVMLSIILVAAGFSFGAGGALGPSILADVIDFDEHETGERKEGVYSAAWGFAFKSGAATILFVAGLTLQWTGFSPGEEQPAAAQLAIRVLNSLFPLVAFLIGALVFRRFSFDFEAHRQIRAELDRRRGS